MLFQITETSVESICSEVTKLRQAAHIDDYNKTLSNGHFCDFKKKRKHVIDTRGTFNSFVDGTESSMTKIFSE